MPKFLNTNELIELSESLGLDVNDLVEKLEDITTQLGERIATKLDVKSGSGAAMGLAFGGLCVPFYPDYEGQSLPEALEDYDHSGSWNDFNDEPGI